ncbi:PTS sugar transporter subunit IIC [Devriesea agamarum]|uniref:PTS sugar transporter subunit IIC n=1 Tax=Devriesea agamarum TaxID=472569 RepID=UPI000A014CD8|nr:PTS sugar transporter subunit IIC [Devriesea agamarum]
MTILLGTALLLVVLALFTLFNYKAPYGTKAMGALAAAACASFLVEAFHSSFFGKVLGISSLGEIGLFHGNGGGVAAAALVALALGVSPIYAVMMGLACTGIGILPGFVAGYSLAFVVKWMERKIPPGVDLIVILLTIPPLTHAVGSLMRPVVEATLGQIGKILVEAANSNPVLMGIVLGGVITVVATAPLSSMALTAMMGLQGAPMAIGALSVFGSSFMNFILFLRMKFGGRRETISVAVEPLTQADLISANPIPVYATNFLGGALSGVAIALMGLVNDASGTATPIAGFAVMFAYNDASKVLITAGLCILLSSLTGLAGSIVFRRFPIITKEQLMARAERISARVPSDHGVAGVAVAGASGTEGVGGADAAGTNIAHTLESDLVLASAGTCECGAKTSSQSARE